MPLKTNSLWIKCNTWINCAWELINLNNCKGDTEANIESLATMKNRGIDKLKTTEEEATLSNKIWVSYIQEQNYKKCKEKNRQEDHNSWPKIHKILYL